MTDHVPASELDAAGLRYVVDGSVATITLNRPEVRNAQTPRMWRALAALGERIAEDVRVVIVTGEGPTFSAGLDRRMLDPADDSGAETVAELLALDDDAVIATIGEYQRGFTFLRDPRFISIAAVRGYAIGAGFQLALSCDLRIVGQSAQFSMKESALGLVPDLTGTKPLVAAVGYPRALEICATARMVPADEAVAIGLVQTAVPDDRLDEAVREAATRLSAAPHDAITETKRLLLAAPERDLAQQSLAERTAQVRRFRALARAMT